MSTQSTQTFTATVEAQSADEIRDARTRTDDDIRADSSVPLTDDQVRRERVLDAHHDAINEINAVNAAVGEVIRQARQSVTTTVPHSSVPDRRTNASPLILEGAVFTISMADLVATATLTLPDNPFAATPKTED